MTRLEIFLKTYGSKATAFINQRINESKAPEKIKEACLYSINTGGKRIRPVLFLMTLDALEITITDKHLAFASAIEMIHTYSLIHDDLPAMDNDEYRRGQLTCHVRFTEAYAILAGDALLNLAFEVMLEYCVTKKDIAAAREISKASGYEGMIGGQVLDMAKPDTVKDILEMYSLKTGALIRTSVISAAVMSGCNKKTLKRLSDYAMNLGIAFQLRDDYLDKTDINDKTGKPKDSDKKNNKATYISKKGITANEQKLHKHTDKALKAIVTLDEKFDMLRSLANYLDNRMK